MTDTQTDGVVLPNEPTNPTVENEVISPSASEDVEIDDSNQTISRREKKQIERDTELSQMKARMAELEAKSEFIDAQWGDSEKRDAIQKHGLDSIDNEEYEKELKSLLDSGLSRQKSIEIAVRLQQQKKEQSNAEEKIREEGRQSASLPAYGSTTTPPQGFRKMSKDEYVKFSMDTPKKLEYIKKYNAHWESKNEKPYA